MNVDDCDVIIRRPCINCEGKPQDVHCPACGGSMMAEARASFGELVKMVLADVFAKPQIESLNADVKILVEARDKMRVSRDGFEKSAHNLTEEVERLRGVIERMEKKASE